jgi:hypothetical protein
MVSLTGSQLACLLERMDWRKTQSAGDQKVPDRQGSPAFPACFGVTVVIHSQLWKCSHPAKATERRNLV